MMDGMDGYEFFQELAKDLRCSKIPFVFLTAKTATEDILKGFEMGSVDFIKKPFEINELMARIRVHIELKLIREKLDFLSRIDPLTRLSNRRDILEKLSCEKARFDRNFCPFSVILCDVDRFKSINDKYGHDGGDFVIASIAKIILTSLRKQDYAARWGGEEFLIVLPSSGGKAGKAVAEKLRCEIDNHKFTFNEMTLHVTMSFGAIEFNAQLHSIDQAISLADKALYEGKRKGRNYVILWEKDNMEIQHSEQWPV
jgi:diguanylate cyclase (GGDEF)-like protein